MITADRYADVAKAMESAHDPANTGQGYEQDAKTFIAAFNACVEIMESGRHERADPIHEKDEAADPVPAPPIPQPDHPPPLSPADAPAA